MIILATDMSPSDTAQMDHQHVKGFATELGGPTSHSAILAKGAGDPVRRRLGRVLQNARQGQMAIIDGYEGRIILNPDARETGTGQVAAAAAHGLRPRVAKAALAAGRDGRRLPRRAYSANVELPSRSRTFWRTAPRASACSAPSSCTWNRTGLPSEEDQFSVYKKVVESVAPHPVIFRTIDLGGDKFLSALQPTREVNPFMGLRAIRLCLAHPGVFKTQLRALLRASAHGNAKIMFPMISSVREVLQAKAILDEIKADLLREGRRFNEEIQIGIMIEIPSAAVCSDILAREVDFFSIGTNDLIQYTLAVDRGNEQVVSLYDPFHPAILRLIRTTIEAARREGIWVGVCGEVAANPLCALLLIGLGINELSMGALAIPEIKRLIRGIRLADARGSARKSFRCARRATSTPTCARPPLSSSANAAKPRPSGRTNSRFAEKLILPHSTVRFPSSRPCIFKRAALPRTLTIVWSGPIG